MEQERLREAPAERFDATSLVFDFKAEADAIRKEPVSSKHGHRQKTLYKHGGRTIALFVMESGSMIPEHSANGTVSIQPIEGEMEVSVAGEEHRLHGGQLLVISTGVRHEVRAKTDSVFVLQISLGA